MRLTSALVTAAATFGVDRLSKIVVLDGLELASAQRIEVAPPFLVLRMTWNSGVNFGLFADTAQTWPYILAGLAAAISAVLLYWAWRMPDLRGRIAVGLVVGGALGNALDRMIYGAVADFLNMSCCGVDNPFSFNVADAAIFLGAAALILRDAPDDDAAKGRG